jgi:hypothetical protein
LPRGYTPRGLTADHQSPNHFFISASGGGTAGDLVGGFFQQPPWLNWVQAHFN